MQIIKAASRSYPAQDGRYKGNEIIITIVLVDGNGNDYAAYAGFGSPGFVKMSGRKLSFKEASIYFGGLKQKLYRG